MRNDQFKLFINKRHQELVNTIWQEDLVFLNLQLSGKKVILGDRPLDTCAVWPTQPQPLNLFAWLLRWNFNLDVEFNTLNFDSEISSEIVQRLVWFRDSSPLWWSPSAGFGVTLYAKWIFWIRDLSMAKFEILGFYVHEKTLIYNFTCKLC